MKKQLTDQLKINGQDKLHTDAVKHDNEILKQFSGMSEFMRRRCTQDLQASLSKNDGFANHIGLLEQNQKFIKVQYSVVEEQFKLLFDSIQTISNAKNMEDRFKHMQQVLQGNFNSLLDENNNLQIQVNKLISERD